jgi:glycosyltransferase involved in cell wall biosynthesis
MTILVINWQDWLNPLAGGAEIYLYKIFSRLIRKGHRVLLLVSRAAGQKRYERIDKFEIFRVGRRANFNFIVPWALRALMRHEKIDVIIDDLNKIPFYSRVFTKKLVVPMLMHLFREAIYRETNFLAASYVYLTENLIPILYPRTEFVAISQSTAEDLQKLGVQRKVHVVECGIPDIPAGDIRRRKDLIAYVGRVKRYKSIQHFIKAVRTIQDEQDIEALVVGDGDARVELEAYACKINATITFTGFVSEEEKYRIYKQARVIVQPSIKEGWGLTAIEAQACGTPVVCANSPGLREVVQHNRTGLHYPYGDISELVRSIRQLLYNDKEWHAFAEAARVWARGFSWDKAAEKLENILKKAHQQN